MKISSTTFKFFYPDHDLSNDKSITTSSGKIKNNNTSIVFKAKYGDIDLLFTGDAEKELERYIVKQYGNKLGSEIYKMGHHGSAGSSQPFFLKQVQPEDSIASAGRDNYYGHPSLRVIKRLQRRGSDIWRTDLDGDVTIFLTGDNYEITSEK